MNNNNIFIVIWILYLMLYSYLFIAACQLMYSMYRCYLLVSVYCSSFMQILMALCLFLLLVLWHMDSGHAFSTSVCLYCEFSRVVLLVWPADCGEGKLIVKHATWLSNDLSVQRKVSVTFLQLSVCMFVGVFVDDCLSWTNVLVSYSI